MVTFQEIAKLKSISYHLNAEEKLVYCLQSSTRLVVVDIVTNSVVNERQVVKSYKLLFEKGMIICVSSSFV